MRAKDKKDYEAQIAEARERIAELEAELAQNMIRDPLTDSLLTLRAFNSQLQLDCERAHRYGRPLSLLWLDVDGFGQFNIEHGYEAGDHLLIEIARTIIDQTRANDIACRVGNDEFALLYPETAGPDAELPIERMLAAMGALEAGKVPGVTVSGGLTGLAGGQQPEHFVATAQAALAEAQELGGGRAVSSFADNLVGAGTEPPPRGDSPAEPSDQAEGAAVAGAKSPDDGPPLELVSELDAIEEVAEEVAAAAESESPPGAEPAASAVRSEGWIHPDRAAAGLDAIGGDDAEAVARVQEEVTDAAAELATMLEVEAHEVEMVRSIAYLYNLGVGASGEQAAQVVAGLDQDGWAQVRSDPAAAGQLVGGISGMSGVAEALKGLAEHHDGSGPAGKRGEAIPLAARIVNPLATYFRLAAAEPVGSGISRDDAITTIARGSGTKFSPDVVDKLISFVYKRSPA